MSLADINARIANDPGLKAAADNLRVLPWPSFMIAPDGRILAANQALEKFLGAPLSELFQVDDIGYIESLMGLALKNLCGDNDQAEIREFSFSNLQSELKFCHITACKIGPENAIQFFIEDISEVKTLQGGLLRVKSELDILSQVSEALGSSLSVESILQRILIAVTARQGLGLNRAFLMFLDSETNTLKGHMAVGPSSPEEAGRIWGSLSDEHKNLNEVLHDYIQTLKVTENNLNERIRALQIPLGESNHLIENVVQDRRGMIIYGGQCKYPGKCKVCGLMGVDQFAAVPMISNDKVLGIITADNQITGKPISHAALSQLQVFANQAAIAIDRTRLMESLALNLKELKTAHMKLKQMQDELLKIERLSLWSELTYDIAHELRNPASIIGGFASLMIKSDKLPEPLQEQAQIIFNECARLESALNSVLDFSRSFSQEKSEFHLTELLTEVIDLYQVHSEMRSFESQLPQSSHEYVTCARRDQIKYALYTVMSMIEEHLQGQTSVKISLESADNYIKVLFTSDSDDTGKDSIFSALINKKAGKSALKSSMALEALKYNGGNMGIESAYNGQPRIYIELTRARR